MGLHAGIVVSIIGLCLKLFYVVMCPTPLSTDIEAIYKEATPRPPSSPLNTPGPTQSTTCIN